MADHMWSGLKPSRARVADSSTHRSRQDPNHHPGSSSLRDTDPWTANVSSDGSRGVGAALSHEPSSPGLQTPAVSGAAPKRCMRLVPVAGRGVLPGVMEHRQGWHRISSPTPPGTDQQRHCYRFDCAPCSESKLDEEMTILESQITRTVSSSFSNLLTRTSSLSQDSLALVTDSAPVKAEAGSSGEKSKFSELVRSGSGELKRKRSGIPEQDVQMPGKVREGDCGWIHPLKLLVRKALTQSDVGELGRIIIPKKDAESRLFPQLDSKEGTVLELEDYTASKRWYFRFKYWINNKSRMYVLENTGEFIKYHSLKEHDMLVVYEDGCNKLVVCGQKKNRSASLDSLLEDSNLKSSASEPLLTTATTATTSTTATATATATEEDISRRTIITDINTFLPIPEELSDHVAVMDRLALTKG